MRSTGKQSGLGPPERDLWMVTGETGEEARRYAGLTGHAVYHGLLEWYLLALGAG